MYTFADFSTRNTVYEDYEVQISYSFACWKCLAASLRNI